ncbi:MAG: hypothetical protein KatS3mg057_2538 [Herpetosiphonaceae bacterium]|nr:MAG: hypothetical protein KatS3mg057_2538 [Herpetosiphonaceae bacterium]
MAGESKVTTDHNQIRKWVEERGGKPATVKGTGDKGEPGVLRINFPGYGDEESLREISWEDFFEKFEEKQLAFLYQEELKSGQESRFFKFVSRETAKEKGKD